ncbi:hypothetical protein ACROYT_G036802 [Oculina patagonica]
MQISRRKHCHQCGIGEYDIPPCEGVREVDGVMDPCRPDVITCHRRDVELRKRYTPNESSLTTRFRVSMSSASVERSSYPEEITLRAVDAGEMRRGNRLSMAQSSPSSRRSIPPYSLVTPKKSEKPTSKEGKKEVTTVRETSGRTDEENADPSPCSYLSVSGGKGSNRRDKKGRKWRKAGLRETCRTETGTHRHTRLDVRREPHTGRGQKIWPCQTECNRRGEKGQKGKSRMMHAENEKWTEAKRGQALRQKVVDLGVKDQTVESPLPSYSTQIPQSTHSNRQAVKSTSHSRPQDRNSDLFPHYIVDTS